MYLSRLHLRHWRNSADQVLELPPEGVAIIGDNGQGKTNLLEAAGFVSALRSFRTVDTRMLIAHDQPEAALACEFEHEKLGPTKIGRASCRERV